VTLDLALLPSPLGEPERHVEGGEGERKVGYRLKLGRLDRCRFLGFLLGHLDVLKGAGELDLVLGLDLLLGPALVVLLLRTQVSNVPATLLTASARHASTTSGRRGVPRPTLCPARDRA
jgi:hypothetical protein